MKKIIALTAVLALVLAGAALAQDDSGTNRGSTKTGIAGAQFLKIGIGARTVAMSDASVAMIDDSTSCYWNPAGLADVKGTDITFTDVEWIADMRLMSGTFAHKFGFGTIGAMFTMLSVGEMEYRDEHNPDDPNAGTFTANDMMFGGSYARRLIDRFAFGGTVKYVREKIDTYTAQGVAFDVGTTYITGFKSLKMGISIQNFGPELKFGGTFSELQRDKQTREVKEFASYSLPITVKLGISYDLFQGSKNHLLTLALDAVHPNDGPEKLNLGAEYWIKNMLALRGGYLVSGGDFRSEELRTFSAGVGFKYNLGSTGIRFDYAFTDMDVLNAVHRVTMGFCF
jgi:hypothetical protein